MLKIVDSILREPWCPTNVPVPSQDHHHLAANIVMFLSQTKVSTGVGKYLFENECIEITMQFRNYPHI